MRLERDAALQNKVLYMDSEEELEAAYQDKYQQSQILEFIEKEVERRESLSSSSDGLDSITPTPTTSVQIDIKTNAVRYADDLNESEDILTAVQKYIKSAQPHIQEIGILRQEIKEMKFQSRLQQELQNKSRRTEQERQAQEHQLGILQAKAKIQYAEDDKRMLESEIDNKYGCLLNEYIDLGHCIQLLPKYNGRLFHWIKANDKNPTPTKSPGQHPACITRSA